MPFSTMMVHVNIEHDSERRIELAISLADRFQASLIGVAGYALWPAFMGGDVGLTESNQYDLQRARARVDERGKTFRARGGSVERIEGRSAFEPVDDVVWRAARRADRVCISS